MKRNITLFLFASFFSASIFGSFAYGQNTSPFWSLAGNSNANSASKLGTTTADQLNLTTNNVTRMLIYANGRIGVGNRITPSNTTRALNLTDTAAVMRILRVHPSNAPAIELISRTTADGANVAYWDMYAEPSDKSFRIRDRQTGSNLDRLTIDHANGFVGIGTTTPTQLLHVAGTGVFTGSVGIGTTSPSFIFDARSSFSFGQFKATSGWAGVILDKSADNQREYVVHRSAGVDLWTEGTFGNNNFSIHNFGGADGDAVTIDHTNNFVGLSATDPAFPLDLNGRLRIRSQGGGLSAGLWVNNLDNSALTGFMGTLNNTTMGWYGAGYGWSVLMNTNNGYLGVHNGSPQTELHLMHGIGDGASFGLRIQNSGPNNNEWTQYVQNSDGRLQLYFKGVIKGNFDAASGTYTAASDARFKKNVEKSEDVLDNIMKLGVKRYQFIKNQTDGRRYYGMIAQEVEKIFPDVVYHSKGDDGKEFYTMDYSAMGTIAIKGIQELKPAFDKQQEQITQLQQQNEMLKQELAELKQMIARISGDQTLLSSGMSTLGIATPNPVRGSAQIQYEVPQNVGNARLLITDALGRTIRTIQLSKSGSVNVDVSTWSSGVYNYSLIADGKTLQTKKMTVQR